MRAYSYKAYLLIKPKSNVQYQYKRQKFDAIEYIGFLVSYKSTNIYWIWVPLEKKVVSVRDMIIKKDIVWDEKSILYFDDNIKELDETIVYIEIHESKAEEI